MNITNLLTDRHKRILLQIYNSKDRSYYCDGTSRGNIDLCNGLKYEGEVISLWGGCNYGGAYGICKCRGGCSQHKGLHINNYDGKSQCWCKGDRFIVLDDNPTVKEKMLINDLADLVYFDLIEQYKGNIYLTDKGISLCKNLINIYK